MVLSNVTSMVLSNVFLLALSHELVIVICVITSSLKSGGEALSFYAMIDFKLKRRGKTKCISYDVTSSLFFPSHAYYSLMKMEVWKRKRNLIILDYFPYKHGCSYSILYCLQELPDVPLFLSLHNLCATLKCTSPSAVIFRSAVINAGYRISGTHVNPLGLKSDAPMDVVWDIMRCWVSIHV